MQQTIFVPNSDSFCCCYVQPRPDRGWKNLIVHLICVQLPALLLVDLRAHLCLILCPKNKTSYVCFDPQRSQNTANKAICHVQTTISPQPKEIHWKISRANVEMVKACDTEVFQRSTVNQSQYIECGILLYTFMNASACSGAFNG